MSAARLAQQPVSTGRWIRLEAASQCHSGSGCDRYGRTWVSRGQERPDIDRSWWLGELTRHGKEPAGARFPVLFERGLRGPLIEGTFGQNSK